MSAKNNFNKAFSKGAKGRTNFLVFGVLAIAVAGAAALVSKKNASSSDAAASVMRAPEGANVAVDAGKASDSYLKTLQDSNAQEIANARKNGTSAVSTLTGKPVKTDEVPVQEQAPTVIVAQNPNGPPNPPGFTPAQGGHMQMRDSNNAQGPQGLKQHKGLSDQVVELLDTWKAPGQSIYANRGEGAALAAASAAAAAAATTPAAATSAPAESGNPVVLIPAGKMVSAVIDTQAVSDDGGPVRATIVAGPYNGALLIGSMTVNRDMAKLMFHTMSFKGTSVSVSAVALDPDTGRVGMADNVDKHWFEKYGLVFVSSFIGGYGEAASSVGQTVTQTAGATVVEQEALSPKMRTQVALGKSGTTLSQQLAQESTQVKTTVTINQGKPLGVMFMKDVVSQ